MWLAPLFFLAAHCPGLLRRLREPAAHGAFWMSGHVRRVTAANARRLFDRPGRLARYRYACGVVSSFVDFVVDVGEVRGWSPTRLRGRVAESFGVESYIAARRANPGAIHVTAHKGSLEVGLAALRDVEPRVHVVFKRDAFGTFEKLRSEMRATLGVNELAVDDGWQTLMAMRSALESDEVIVMQGDRAMPGQRAQPVRVRGGQLLLPVGPATLARLTGSPIVPDFTIRRPDGRFEVHLLEPIVVDPDAPLVGGLEPALVAIGAAIDRFLARYPQQWLVLEPAFAEDSARVDPRHPDR
jgi:KDO2-lipid IV(A) lauroyltransferase